MKIHFSTVVTSAALTAALGLLFYPLLWEKPDAPTESRTQEPGKVPAAFAREIAAPDAAHRRHAKNTIPQDSQNAAVFPVIEPDTLYNRTAALLHAMNDSQLREWGKAEMEQNKLHFLIAFTKRWDANGDGILSEEERNASMQEGQRYFKGMQERMRAFFPSREDMQDASEEDRRRIMETFRDAFIDVGAEVYDQFGYDPQSRRFPEGNREKMAENVVKEFETYAGRMEEKIMQTRLQQLGL